MPKIAERKFTEKEKDRIYDCIISIIEHLGNQSKLGQILDITQPQVHYLLYGETKVREADCILLQYKFGRLGVKKEILRPDLFSKEKYTIP